MFYTFTLVLTQPQGLMQSKEIYQANFWDEIIVLAREPL